MAAGADECGVTSALRVWVMAVRARVCVCVCVILCMVGVGGSNPLLSAALLALVQDGAGRAAWPPG